MNSGKAHLFRGSHAPGITGVPVRAAFTANVSEGQSRQFDGAPLNSKWVQDGDGSNVAVGSKAALTVLKWNVRYAPEGGLTSDIAVCLKSAKKRHWRLASIKIKPLRGGVSARLKSI